MSDTRPCDWCNNHGEGILPGFIQYEEDGVWIECQVCEGSAEIADVCYCEAKEPGECACNADWSDYVSYEDHDLEYWEGEQ